MKVMYITIKQTFQPHAKFEDLFSATSFEDFNPITPGYTPTFTKNYDPTPEELLDLTERYDLARAGAIMRTFPKIETFLQEDMSQFYYSFHIPKASGGLRRIDAPNPELSSLITQIKDFFEKDLHILVHNAAFAYVKQRSTRDALLEHQKNESKWFLKLDVKDFFPSCTFEFIIQQLKQIFPFNVIYGMEPQRQILESMIKVSLLNGVLPQGTPLSPLLTNIIMVPIDHALTGKLFYHNRQKFVYTRYADDLLISSKIHFDPKEIEALVKSTLLNLNTPFQIKAEKTRYGSSAGRNWNLGLMLNKDNNITIGYRKKERLRATIYKFLQDLTNNSPWSILDTQILLGNLSYFRQVEPNYVNDLITKYNNKFNKDFLLEAKAILKS